VDNPLTFTLQGDRYGGKVAREWNNLILFIYINMFYLTRIYKYRF